MTLWETITEEAAAESPLWGAALRPQEERELLPVFSPLGGERFALATESIYEGYLLHYGRPRLFQATDDDTAVLLGDYLYAHGLVRLASLGDVVAVSDLAELISLCTQLRAGGREATESMLDGSVWAATAALLGAGDGRLERAREALRLERRPDALSGLARDVAGAEAVDRALVAHAKRVCRRPSRSA
jgi:hypothetical protein